MSSPLEKLAGPQGPLGAEAPDAREFASLVNQGTALLADAENRSVSLHGRFLFAYAAAHSLCLAALRHRGYRPRDARYIVFQALPHTLGLGPQVWRVLDDAHRRRNLAEYAGELDLSEAFVAGLIEAGRIVLNKVQSLPGIDSSL